MRPATPLRDILIDMSPARSPSFDPNKVVFRTRLQVSTRDVTSRKEKCDRQEACYSQYLIPCSTAVTFVLALCISPYLFYLSRMCPLIMRVFDEYSSFFFCRSRLNSRRRRFRPCSSPYIVFDRRVISGNKLLSNTAKLSASLSQVAESSGHRHRPCHHALHTPRDLQTQTPASLE